MPKQSWLEKLFEEEWSSIAPDLVLVPEYSDIPAWEDDYQRRKAENPHAKRYRADFALPEHQVAFECQGAIWKRQGSHTAGAGYEKDSRKLLLAASCGWRVVYVTANLLNDAERWFPRLAAGIRQRPQTPSASAEFQPDQHPPNPDAGPLSDSERLG